MKCVICEEEIVLSGAMNICGKDVCWQCVGQLVRAHNQEADTYVDSISCSEEEVEYECRRMEEAREKDEDQGFGTLWEGE